MYLAKVEMIKIHHRMQLFLHDTIIIIALKCSEEPKKSVPSPSGETFCNMSGRGLQAYSDVWNAGVAEGTLKTHINLNKV